MKTQSRERLQRVLPNARAAGQHRGGKEPGDFLVSHGHTATSAGTCLGTSPRTLTPACG